MRNLPCRAAAVALVAALTLATSDALADELSLICAGSGTYPTAQHQSGSAYNPSTGQQVYGSGTATQVVSINASVRFELNGEAARIWMPPAMTPPMNNGSDAGWWELDRLQVDEDRVTGRFTLNFLNKPQIVIDRRAGTIEVDGNFRYYFLGECELNQRDASERRF
jgi:hypothetical protein